MNPMENINARIRQAVLMEAWEAIDQMIPRGPLPDAGMGIDPQAQRNGMILACNALMEMIQAETKTHGTLLDSKSR